MKNSFINSMNIELTYSVNSFIYYIRKLPVFHDLITDQIYSDRNLKKRLRFISILFLVFKKIVGKLIYIFLLLGISRSFFPKHEIESFFHIYFVFTIIGLFLQNKLLNTSKRQYFSLILFDMDDTLFFRTTFIWNQLSNLFLNGICFLVLHFVYKIPLFFIIIGVVLPFFTRIIGESLNIIYYQKYHYLWYANTKLYFILLGSLLSIAALPFLNVFLSKTVIMSIVILFMIGSIPACIYLWSIHHYKAMYKKINEQVKEMNSNRENDYMKQMMVNVKNKDSRIPAQKLEGKKDYDRFNVIFFERHKQILMNSVLKISFLLFGIYLFIIVYMFYHPDFTVDIMNFYQKNFSYFFLFMYFINRGPIVTQAMFFNCDHAMLRYNFYRENKTVLSLFYKRLQLLTKINLIPAIVIMLGNLIIEIFLHYSIPFMIIHFGFIFLLSILLSVHYLSIYYLLQPYNHQMEMRKISYHFVSILTFVVMNYLTFSSFMSINKIIVLSVIIILYIIVLLRLVKKYASQTFKIN